MGQAVAAALGPDYGASTCRGQQAGFSDTQAHSVTWPYQTRSAISGPGSMPCPSVNLLGNLSWGHFPWPSGFHLHCVAPQVLLSNSASLLSPHKQGG